jgi:hypothetical protein
VEDSIMHRALRTIIAVGLMGTIGGTLLGANCSPPPPAIVITAPLHGDFHFESTSGTTVNVLGKLQGVSNLSDSTVYLWFNEVGPYPNAIVASIDQNARTFQAQLTFPPGENEVYYPIVAEWRRGPGGATVLRATVTVVRADNPADNRGTGTAESALIRLTQSGIDAAEGFITSTLAGTNPLAPLLWTDLADERCIVHGPFNSCLVRIHDAIITQAAMAPMDVDLTAQLNLVHALVDTPDAQLSIHLVGTALLGFTCDIPVDLTHITALGNYTLEPDSDDPRFIDVEQLDDVAAHVQAVDFEINCAGVTGGLLGNVTEFAVGLANVDLTAAVEGALEDFLNGTTSGQQPIEIAFESSLHGLQLGQTVGSAIHVDLNGTLSGVPENVLGVTAQAEIHPTVTETLCSPGQPLQYEPWACPALSPQIYMVPTSDPEDWTAATPTPDADPYDLALALSDTALSTLFNMVAQQGRLSVHQTNMAACQQYTNDGEAFGTDQLTFGCLVGNDPVACLFLGENCSDFLQIRAYPVMAPVLRGGTGIANTMGDVVTQFNVDLLTDPGRMGLRGLPRLVTRLSVLVSMGIDLVVDTVSGSPQLSIQPYLCVVEEPGMPCNPDVKVTVVSANFNDPYITPNLIEIFVLADDGLIEGALVSALDGAVASFPLPTIAGLEMSPVLTIRHGGFNGHLMAFANLVAP